MGSVQRPDVPPSPTTQRAGVMHAGPGSRIKGIIDVDLGPEERDRTHDRSVAVYRQVHQMIRGEVAIAMRRSESGAEAGAG